MKRQIRPRDEFDYKKLTGKYSDESEDETELFVKKTPHQEPPSVEKVVEEGDTLQSLAIRYRCTVEELKRLNHILNDNEIYAKGVIKVPDRPLSDILAGIHCSGHSSPKELDTLRKEHLETSINTLCNQPSTSVEENVNNVIFNTRIASKTCDISDNDEERIVDEKITLLSQETTAQYITPSKLSCSGADADISWISLIICIVTLVVALPLIFVFYIAEHPVHNNSHHI